jgi:hypothetical protein
MSAGVFAIPQNLKKKTKKGKPMGTPIVLDLGLDRESGLYSLEFAGRKCTVFFYSYYRP